jgi:hypothetical protein
MIIRIVMCLITKTEEPNAMCVVRRTRKPDAVYFINERNLDHVTFTCRRV